MSKIGCYPRNDAKPGSKHILVGRTVGEKEFYWTGNGWSSNKNMQWMTGPSQMAVLGWSYLKPVESEK